MTEQPLSLSRLACCTLWVAVCVSAFSGCGLSASSGGPGGSGHSQAANGDADKVAQELSGMMSTRDLPYSDEARRVRGYVLKKAAVGDVQGMSRLVPAPGSHRDAPWYGVFAEAFARSMNECRCRPVNLESPLKGAGEAVAAMKGLAESYGAGPAGREVRVLAAGAIRSDDPKLATKVLLNEYANFTVGFPGYMDPDWYPPTKCGPILAELGHPLPEEVNSIDEVRRLLQAAPYKLDDKDSTSELTVKLAAAANAFNRHLRRLLDEGKESELRFLFGMDVRAPVMAKLYQSAKPDPGPGIFE